MSNPVSQTILAYDEIAKAYAATWFDDPVMEPILDRFLEFIESGDVLDAGCGPGRDILAMAKRGVESVGIDLCAPMIAEAWSRVPDGIFRQMDMRKLKYPPETFAGVWACASIHHLPLGDAAQSLKEFARVLKPEGVLCLTVEEGQGECFDSLGRLRHFYSATEICELINKAGFQIVEVSSSHSSKATFGEGRLKKWLLILARKPIASPIYTDGLARCDCVFCPASRFHLSAKIGVPGHGAILWGDESLYIIPDIAPLVEGHLLMVTTPHHICVGACPEQLFQAIHATRHCVQRLFQEAYSQGVVFFEHGPARHREAGACIDHAHLHCLPVSLPVKETIEQLLGSGQPASLDTLRRLHLAGQSYLYVEEERENGWAYSVDAIPSQYFRQIITSLLGQESWQWQTSRNLVETKQRYRFTLNRLLPLADALWS